MKTFTAKDLGCHIDGAFGEDHRRRRLSQMVQPFSRELADALSFRGTDEDEDEAVELLQEHTQEGLIWSFEGGDLCLLDIEEFG